MHESQHVNEVQQAALKLLTRVQSVKCQTAAGRKLMSKAHKQLLNAIENLGRARTVEAQHEQRKG